MWVLRWGRGDTAKMNRAGAPLPVREAGTNTKQVTAVLVATEKCSEHWRAPRMEILTSAGVAEGSLTEDM